MNTDNRDEPLSPEETAVDNMLSEATKRIEEIEFWKSNIPPLSGPSLVPPGFSQQRWTPEKRANRKKELENRIEQVKVETKDNAVKLLEKSSLETQLKLYQKIDDWAEPKLDREANKKERKALKKDVSYSQDLTMVMLNAEKEKVKFSDQSKGPVEGKEPAIPQEVPHVRVPMSDRFNATPHYNSRKEEPGEARDKSNKSKDIDKED